MSRTVHDQVPRSPEADSIRFLPESCVEPPPAVVVGVLSHPGRPGRYKSGQRPPPASARPRTVQAPPRILPWVRQDVGLAEPLRQIQLSAMGSAQIRSSPSVTSLHLVRSPAATILLEPANEPASHDSPAAFQFSSAEASELAISGAVPAPP